MMKSRTSAVALALMLSWLSLAPLRALAAPPPGDPDRWSARMRELHRTLSSLLTDVSSEKRFKDPKRRARIERETRKLADLAHGMNAKASGTIRDRDPSIGLFGALFEDRARLAYRSLKGGHTEYARELLRGIPGHCIACHTRTRSGPSFGTLAIEPDAADLSGLERGAFFASTRQFDRALKELDVVISDADAASARPFEWADAVRYSLAIAVRYQRDPERARTIVQQLAKNQRAPLFMRENAARWLESIEEWAKEPKREAMTEEGLHSEAIRLLALAHSRQKYPMDRSADILYLRASSATHDLLQAAPNGSHSGEALLMAGICYEVLTPFHIGEIHDIYYEACVRSHPASTVAVACFHRYQESVYAGHTGSSGTLVPSDAKEKLRLLEEIARPSKTAP